jgi:hypothetical protein
MDNTTGSHTVPSEVLHEVLLQIILKRGGLNREKAEKLKVE